MVRSRLGVRWRKIRATWRDTGLLFGQFRWPLLIFTAAVVGGGLLYFQLAHLAQEPVNSRVESMYHVLGLIFFQPIEPFPITWYLQIFFFLMPVIGVGILAQGIAEFGVLFFNRRERSKEWEMAVASTYSSHTILVGLGHLGYRVVLNLHSMDQDVVVVERNPKADLLNNVRSLNIPVLVEDATRAVTLEGAGIYKAHSIILCTQNDSLNLQIALKGRSLNPNVNVIVRIFDDDFALALEKQFGFTAMSATGMAAPAFASAAAGVDMTRPITIEGKTLSLARLTVLNGSVLAGMPVGKLESKYELSVVLLDRHGDQDLHPTGDRTLQADDVLAVLGGPAEIAILTRDNCRHL